MSRILFDELWINLADITYAPIYICAEIGKLKEFFKEKIHLTNF